MVKKKYSIKSILDHGELKSYLDSISDTELAVFKNDITDLIYYWMGYPSKERLKYIYDKFSFLHKLIDYSGLKKRLKNFEKIKDDPFGISISDFMPELIEIRDECYERFSLIPTDLKKAELWLLPIALQAGADADIEAAIYFASRNKNIVDSKIIKERWIKSICHDIKRGRRITRTLSASLIKKLDSGTILLSEAATLLTFNGSLYTFFSFRDEEQDFIDPSFFRAIEWMKISGFDPWVNAIAEQMTVSELSEINHIHVSWYLFFWCRSNLAIRKSNKFGLETSLWSLINGGIEKEKPWRQYSFDLPGVLIDYLPIASNLIFAFNIIKPQNIEWLGKKNAIELLFSSQLPNGSWPIKSDDTEGSIIGTCFTIHALAIEKPDNWKKSCDQGVGWLLAQQKDVGCWHEDGGPTTMLTVLVLDTIELVSQKPNLTFHLEQEEDFKEEKIDDDIEYPNYDYSSESWEIDKVPSHVSMSIEQAKTMLSPKLSFGVATDIELIQLLKRLKPIKKKKYILMVSYENETYYLGKFGQFDAVVVLSTMGSEGVSGSTLTIDSMIRIWSPKAVILVGIAFGANKKKHLPGDVLISDSIVPYELQRLGTETIQRNSIPPCSSLLLNRFRNSFRWNFYRPDMSKVSKHIGPILTGGKLVDNLDFKMELLRKYPTAIGGEMEGSGLFSAATKNRTEWIIVKGVCDWGDGRKNDNFQPLAVASSVSICELVFSEPNALDGL